MQASSMTSCSYGRLLSTYPAMVVGPHAQEDSGILEGYILTSPDATFLALFRMHRASFWRVVEILTSASGVEYWERSNTGLPARPIYQQIAAALCVLGGGEGVTRERNRITLNIGYGTMWAYTWRTIMLLARLFRDYVRLPRGPIERPIEDPIQRPIEHPIESEHKVFHRCIGFLGCSNIVLRYKPIVDAEYYLSRQNNYGFNLQEICNWDGRFIWAGFGYAASAHDNTAWKRSNFYPMHGSYFDPEEYILAGKAYSLERHIITPYKEADSGQPPNAAFNYELSIPRVKIEYAFGVLKARWPTLNKVPARINTDKRRGHERVFNWTIACLVLHILLNGMQDDTTWLQAYIEREAAAESARNISMNENPERMSGTEAKEAGIRRRDELCERVARQQARA